MNRGTLGLLNKTSGQAGSQPGYQVGRVGFSPPTGGRAWPGRCLRGVQAARRSGPPWASDPLGAFSEVLRVSSPGIRLSGAILRPNYSGLDVDRVILGA